MVKFFGAGVDKEDMYDPVILLSVLNDIEQKTKNGSISRQDLGYEDSAHKTALDYLYSGFFLDWGTGNGPSVIFRVNFQGQKLRYDLEKQIQQEREQQKENQDVAETQQDTAAIRRMTHTLLKVGLAGLAVALATLAITISQCNRHEKATVQTKQAVEQSAPLSTHQTINEEHRDTCELQESDW